MTGQLGLPGLPTTFQQQDIDHGAACPHCFDRLERVECECALAGYADGCAIEAAELRGEEAPRPWCLYGARCPSCGWLRLDRWGDHGLAGGGA